jgi:UBA/TS-N domain
MPAAAAPTAGAGAPQPAAQQPAAAPAAAAAGGGSEAKLQQLVGLGFSRQQAEEALAVCGGDADRAASFLFESSMGF